LLINYLEGKWTCSCTHTHVSIVKVYLHS
jgi:hypothetical protein